MEWPDGERGDDDHERPQAPERDHQAAKEEQVVDALDDVPEARLHEAQRGLIPAWIEPHEPGIAVELEGADGAAGRQKAQRGGDVLPEPVHSRIDRELGLVGADGIFQEHVEQLLVPVEIEIVRKRRSGDVGAGGIV